MKLKRVIAAFMAAVIACGSVAATAGADVLRVNSKGWHYSSGFLVGKLANGHVAFEFTEENELEFSGPAWTKNGWNYEYDFSNLSQEIVVIPSEVNGTPVTSISGDAFTSWIDRSGEEDVLITPKHQKIYIPASITNINPRQGGMYDTFWGKNIFADCSELTDVYYGGSEEDWYNSMGYIMSGGHMDPTTNNIVAEYDNWDGKFTKDSNLTYDGIENVTLHVNCKSIDDEGTIVKFDGSGKTETDKAAKPAKVSGIKKARAKTVIKLSWGESKGATSYVVKYSTDMKTWKTKTVKTNSVKLSKLKAGTKYYFKVAAKNSAGTSAYSKVFSVTTKS